MRSGEEVHVVNIYEDRINARVLGKYIHEKKLLNLIVSIQNSVMGKSK